VDFLDLVDLFWEGHLSHSTEAIVQFATVVETQWAKLGQDHETIDHKHQS
jgi:hypothetical protein